MEGEQIDLLFKGERSPHAVMLLLEALSTASESTRVSIYSQYVDIKLTR